MEAPCKKDILIFVAVACLYLRLAFIVTNLDYPNIVRLHSEPSCIRAEIQYRIHSTSAGEGPLRNASMGMDYRCNVGSLPNGINRTDTLPLKLQEPGLFDFATSVKSTKSILFIGDSVAQQLSEAFDESLGITASVPQHFKEDANASIGYRRGFNGYKEGNKEIISFSSPTNGGGATAYWRLTDIWTTANENKPLPPHTGGGWNQHQIKVLRNQLMGRFNHTKFDAVVMNYNNWVWPEPKVLELRYRDAIRLARTNFNVTTIILVTYPFTKTVNSTKRWNDVHEYNKMLRHLSSEQNAWNETTILVLEFGNLTNQLLWTNARSIGVDMPDPRKVSSLHEWEMLDDVTTRFTNIPVCPISATVGQLCLHMPVVCAEYADENTDCLRNYISFDDMHWCSETIGARWSAGVACLLGCALNECTVRTESSISNCQRRCNDQFMALNPIKHEWIDNPSWLSSC
jgi:hypothetical protein